jgi:hypothetical protein
MSIISIKKNIPIEPKYKKIMVRFKIYFYDS